MMTYNLNAPMTYAAFKDMPTDLQRRYLDKLRNGFGFTDVMLGEMFDLHYTSILNLRRKLNVGGAVPKMWGEQAEARAAAWRKFLGAEADPYEETQICDGIEDQPDEPCEASESVEATEDLTDMERAVEAFYAEAAEENEPLALSDLNATFRGEFDAVRFMQWMSKLPMPEGKVTIRIEVTGA